MSDEADDSVYHDLIENYEPWAWVGEVDVDTPYAREKFNLDFDAVRLGNVCAIDIEAVCVTATVCAFISLRHGYLNILAQKEANRRMME